MATYKAVQTAEAGWVAVGRGAVHVPPPLSHSEFLVLAASPSLWTPFPIQEDLVPQPLPRPLSFLAPGACELQAAGGGATVWSPQSPSHPCRMAFPSAQVAPGPSPSPLHRLHRVRWQSLLQDSSSQARSRLGTQLRLSGAGMGLEAAGEC